MSNKVGCLNEAVLILTGSREASLCRLAHLGISVHLGDFPPGTSTCLACSWLVQTMTELREETGQLWNSCFLLTFLQEMAQGPCCRGEPEVGSGHGTEILSSIHICTLVSPVTTAEPFCHTLTGYQGRGADYL